MDLGYGASNQAVGKAAATALLQTAVAQEKVVEAEISRFDAMLDGGDADALERLRARRLAEMKQQRQDKLKYQALGHGTYQDLGSTNTSDVAKAFFEVSKQSPRVVVHFYRPTSRFCDVFHKHLGILAQRHLETKFVSVNVENCETSNNGAAFLVERLGIVVMPTLLIIKDRQSVHQLRGFDELGNTPDFSTRVLEYILGKYGAIACDSDQIPEDLLSEKSPRGVNTLRMTQGGNGRKSGRPDEEEDF